jgi:urease accessory protein
MSAGRLAECREIDEALEAMKPARELREASRQMGRQTLRLTVALTADARLAGHHAIAGYLAEVDAGRAPGHHGAAFGMTAGALGWGAEETAAAFLYSTATLLVGAALRLLPMGQTEGQRVLWRLHPAIGRAARDAARRDPADLFSFCPGLDVQAMLHERLESRLFRS